jgi:transketolase
MHSDAEAREIEDIRRLAIAIRLHSLRMVSPHGMGYLGQALSSAEIMAAIYTRGLRGVVDRVVVSPGHYSVVVFAAAAQLGLLPVESLSSYGHDGSRLEAIGTHRTTVIDFTCGSLGQGLSVAAGFALADRLRGEDSRTFVLLSDGELQEGQLWEAAMFAGHHHLANVIALVDANNSQVDGPVDSVTTIEPVAEKWRSFGWDTYDVDGHDLNELSEALDGAHSTPSPSVVVCRTSTRHGLSCLPNDFNGHFSTLSAALSAEAEAELSRKLGTHAK